MNGPGREDITLVIPTRDRWDLLGRTLGALEADRAAGLDVIIAVDGEDQFVPEWLAGSTRIVQVPRGGPGAARNAGVAATRRPYLWFLGDDMLPTPGLLDAHLHAHAAAHDAISGDTTSGTGPDIAARTAVLGRVVWHPEVAGDRLARWLEWSASQFDYAALDAEHAAGSTDAGWGRFYSCNVTLPRALFEQAGGFDPAFTFAYEDADLGWRLHEAGMVLRYEPGALVEHLHHYDWSGIEQRFRRIAEGERRMVERHPWFQPFFRHRIDHVETLAPRSERWTKVVDRVPARFAPKLAVRARSEANAYYLQRLANVFYDAWDGVEDLEELQAYLGEDFEPGHLEHHVHEVARELEAAPDEATFYRTSKAYLYDLTIFGLSGTKAPYRRLIRELVAPGSRLLDYGCGIGADGLRLRAEGYRVDFADFDNPSTAFLRWRLARRRHRRARVYDLDRELPTGYDLTYCFDVIEHVEDPPAFLDQLAATAAVVVVNLLEDLPDDPHPHHALDIEGLVMQARHRGLLHRSLHHGRSHLIAFRGTSGPR